MTKIEPATGLALLRSPFPPNQISKLPKETRAQIDARKANKNDMVFNCTTCGGHHHKNAVHLDYVGHAALTDRLLDADPAWSWEPLATVDGLPALDRNGGLWIKLTVCGVTRLGYGSADGKNGGDAIKEIIGDALRNAAMRFGAALDLWHKGDLHADEETQEPERPAPRHDPVTPELITDEQRQEIMTLATAKGIDARRLCEVGNIPSIKEMPVKDFAQCKAWIAKQPAKPVQQASQTSEILDDEIPY
jgi:hypothetical protein